MRENIWLYRAKSVDNGEWVEGYYTKTKYDRHFIIEKDCYCAGYNNDTLYGVVEVEPETVGQDTGLTDKNGKKIWENDIVADICNKIVYRKGIVVWNEIFDIGKNGYEYSNCITGFMVEEECLYEYLISKKLEVIGNKFDNPELLGWKNECRNYKSN